MNDIIDNYKKRLEDSRKKTVNGTLNINLKDIDIKSKNFQVAANNNYYDKSNVHVELNNNFNSINMDNGLTTLNIVIVIDKKIILSKNIHKLNNNIDDIKNLFSNSANNTCGFITYIINSTRNLFIFCNDKSNTISTRLKDDDFKFKDITNDFENDSLLYELYNKIIKLLEKHADTVAN